MSSEKYGSISLSEDQSSWVIEAEPHVINVAKRLWNQGGGYVGKVILDNTASNCVDIDWFLKRYDLHVESKDLRNIKIQSGLHQEKIRRVRDYLGSHRPPLPFKSTIPPRDYQCRSASVVVTQGSLLVADEVGLGKTYTAILPMLSAGTLPALVVTLTHLPRQWESEINKFANGLYCHILRNGNVYPLDGRSQRKGVLKPPDVIITSYSKLSKWAQVLAEYVNYVVFDEAQELRRSSDGKGGVTLKYGAALYIAEKCKYRVGLSATPIYNYGDEIFNVLDVLSPGAMGTRGEFLREWCVNRGNHYHVEKPEAFGTWAREQGLVVRNTRQQVGRELPPIIVSVQEIDSDARALDEIDSEATTLARILLNRDKKASRSEALMAGGDLDRIIRQATGLAKAPFVAEFVRLLVESGEKVLLGGWHHSVYDIWLDRLHHAGIKCSRYTGTENPAQKQIAYEDFVSGESQVLMMSLRSGAGIDGLQDACKVVVIGELDWSPQVHHQFIGRAHRDGQSEPVVAYYLVADSGSDPTLMQALGIKTQQSTGIIDPNRPIEEITATVDQRRGVSLAEAWMKRKGIEIES